MGLAIFVILASAAVVVGVFQRVMTVASQWTRKRRLSTVLFLLVVGLGILYATINAIPMSDGRLTISTPVVLLLGLLIITEGIAGAITASVLVRVARASESLERPQSDEQPN